MASTYPSVLDSFATSRSDATLMAGNHAADHDNLADAINKIEAELGITPKGSFASVAARLSQTRILTNFARSGTLSVTTGVGRFVMPFALTIVGIQLAVNTAPVGSSILCDVNKNGTTIFTTQANRPSVAAGANQGGVATPNITAFAVGDYMTVDVDQIGSTTPGSDLVAVVTYVS